MFIIVLIILYIFNIFHAVTPYPVYRGGQTKGAGRLKYLPAFFKSEPAHRGPKRFPVEAMLIPQDASRYSSIQSSPPEHIDRKGQLRLGAWGCLPAVRC